MHFGSQLDRVFQQRAQAGGCPVSQLLVADEGENSPTSREGMRWTANGESHAAVIKATSDRYGTVTSVVVQGDQLWHPNAELPNLPPEIAIDGRKTWMPRAADSSQRAWPHPPISTSLDGPTPSLEFGSNSRLQDASRRAASA